MSNFLPPILVELRANGAQAISEMGKVAAAAETSTAKMKAAAEKEALAAREAAAKAQQAAKEKIAAAEEAAKAQQLAATKTAEAQAKAAVAAKAAQDAQAKAEADGTEKSILAANQKAAAADRAAAQAETAALRETRATENAAKAQADVQKAKEAAYAADQRAVEAMAASHEASSVRIGNAWQGVKKTADTIAGFTIAGAGIVAAASIKMAADFEKETTLLVTAGGESKSALGAVRDGILDIATSTGTSTSQLADGMYIMEKAGYRGADGLKVLRAAAEGAKAEGVDLQTMANAVTDILLDYGKGADQAVSATNGLVTASGLAKTTMQDFASSMAAIVPTASVAGLSFAQVGGALATMTQHGQSAQQSSQNLANLLTQLERPSNIASKSMQQMGIDVTDLSKNLGDENGGRGLLGSLQLVDQHIKDHMGADGLVVQSTMNKSASAAQDLQKIIAQMPPQLAEQSRAFLDGTVSQKEYMKGYKDMGGSASVLGGQFMGLAKSTLGVNDLLKSGNPALMTYVGMWNRAAGGITGARTAMMLLMNNSHEFEENIKRISEAEDQNGKHIATWADTQSTFNTQLDMTVQSAEKLGIELGAKLLPAAKDLLGGVSDLFHGFEQGNPVLLTTVGVLGSITALVVAGKLIGGIVNIGKSVFDMGRSAKAGTTDFVAGFRSADAAASSFTGKMGTLGGAVSRVLPILGKVGVAAGVAAAAMRTASIAQDQFGTNNAAPSLEQTTQAMVNLATASGNANDMFSKWDSGPLKSAPSDVHNLNDAVGYLNDGFAQSGDSAYKLIQWLPKLFGVDTQDGMDQVKARFDQIGQSLGQMVQGGSIQTAAQGFDKVAEAFTKQGKTSQDALNAMPAYRDALLASANAAGVSLSQEELLEYAMGKVPEKMQAAASATGDYVDAAGRIKPITPELQKSLDAAGVSADGLVSDLDKVRAGMEADGLAVVNARDAQSRMNQSMDDAKKTMDDFVASGHKVGEGLNANATDFDLTTEAGRQLNDKYEAVMKSGEDLANSVKGTGVDAQKQVQDALSKTYDNLVDAGHEMGITGGKADDLARSVLGIPAGVDVHTWMDDYARQKAQDTTNAINAIPTDKTVELTLHYTETGDKPGNDTGMVHANAAGGFQAFAGGGAVGGYPRGGLLSGPGTGISDSMLARVSNGEFIIRAAMVQKYGLDTFTAFNNGAIDAAPGSGSAQGAWNGRTGGGGTSVTVYAQTNATGPQIASEVGWALRNQN